MPRPVKRKAVAKAAEAVEPEDIDWESMTVVKLKAELQAKNLDVTGKKADLIKRLREQETNGTGMLANQSINQPIAINQLITINQSINQSTSRRDWLLLIRVAEARILLPTLDLTYAVYFVPVQISGPTDRKKSKKAEEPSKSATQKAIEQLESTGASLKAIVQVYKIDVVASYSGEYKKVKCHFGCIFELGFASLSPV